MRRVAWLNLRFTPESRVQAFAEGFKRLGYDPRIGCPNQFESGDAFCTWNRIGHGDHVARMFSDRGQPVLVTENASWGNDFAGKRWYTLARDYHNEVGRFPVGSDSRWDSLSVRLQDWRWHKGETVVLPSRGIGAARNRMPGGWVQRQSGRIRAHPGRGVAKPLEEDLANAAKVVTWGSGAAIKALMWGIPVESHMPDWIATQDNTDAGRLAMFRQLAWANWTLEELASGEPIQRLIEWKPTA